MASDLEYLTSEHLAGSNKDQLQSFRRAHAKGILQKQLYGLKLSNIHIAEKEVLMTYCHYYWLHFESDAYKAVVK